MGHDGRFRATGDRKSKLSAVLAVFSQEAVLLENPWAAHALPASARRLLMHYPWFDLPRSIADWFQGAAMQQVEFQRQLIEALAQTRAEEDFPN